MQGCKTICRKIMISIIIPLTMNVPLFLQYYRARYGSEGVRAPLKALNENHHPTVKVEVIHTNFIVAFVIAT